MKRYRVLNFDLDSRATILSMEIDESWEEKVKEQHLRNKKQTEEQLLIEFGSSNKESKIKNFCDLGNSPFSILAFHNKFLHQIRNSFVLSSYYPALTGACSLGERILNHLIIQLRNDFKNTPEYKKVHRKDSFDDWGLAIKTLSSWKILLPDVVKNYEKLEKIRHREAIHFNPATDTNDREIALRAIKTLQIIIQKQFGAFGLQPWFIKGIKGASYIKKEYENYPFIKKIYLPNCVLVGPLHRLEFVNGEWKVIDNNTYYDREIFDREFVELLEKRKTGK